MLLFCNNLLNVGVCSLIIGGWFGVGFPTGRDSATFPDNGTEISSLSRDKGTTGQAQNFATGRDGTGRDFDTLSHPTGQKQKKKH